jgi:hypothetical protein
MHIFFSLFNVNYINDMGYIGYEPIPLAGIVCFALISVIAFFSFIFYCSDPRFPELNKDTLLWHTNEFSATKWLYTKRTTTFLCFVGFCAGAAIIAGKNNFGYSKSKTA